MTDNTTTGADLLPYGDTPSPYAAERNAVIWGLLAGLRAILVLLVILIGAMIAVFVVGIAALILFGDPSALSDPENMPTEYMAPILTIAVMVGFPSGALVAVLWGKVVARRSLKELGFGGPAKLPRYARGFGGGVLLAVLLLIGGGSVAALLGVGEALPAMEWSRLSQPFVPVMLGLTVVTFILQSASEEVIFRGWLFASVTKAAGMGAGLIVSSILFGLGHVDPMGMTPAVLALTLTALSLVGLFLARLAAAEGSIYGACGLHAGYNITLIGSGLILLVVTEEVATASEVVVKLLDDVVENQNAPESMATLATLIGIMAVIHLMMGRFVRRRP